MAVVEEKPNTSEGVFVVICIMLAMMMGTYLFASYVIWTHEQTVQTCIDQGFVWDSDDCLFPN